MLFNSFEFIIFFTVVTLIYFLIPHRFRWSLLLFVSCIFYVTFIPVYILLLFALIIIDYFAAILVDKNVGKKRTLFLIVSILSTCMALFFFKYFNFFNANFAYIAQMIHWNYSVKALSIILPVGLSFHTFQSLSYVIEVYRGKQKPERNFWIYALYVMFYPQLVAGPIERPQNLLHQFYEKHDFDYGRVRSGLQLMLWGFLKKMIVADRLAPIVGLVYQNPQLYQGTPLIIATIFFAFQIYCDFSGYSDIARGIARVMGFELMKNFNRPYFSKSISEFWRRWHISLSSWFRDYVYIPLGGSRVKKIRNYFNILIVFLISGLWHGSNWTFVLWGALHGSYMIVSSVTAQVRPKIKNILNLGRLHTIFQVLFIFILACIGWVFFRANTISDAVYILTHFFSAIKLNIFDMNFRLTKIEIVITLFSLATFLVTDFLIESGKVSAAKINNLSPIIKWILYISLILAILMFGIFKEVQFIYFQF